MKPRVRRPRTVHETFGVLVMSQRTRKISEFWWCHREPEKFRCHSWCHSEESCSGVSISRRRTYKISRNRLRTVRNTLSRGVSGLSIAYLTKIKQPCSGKLSSGRIFSQQPTWQWDSEFVLRWIESKRDGPALWDLASSCNSWASGAKRFSGTPPSSWGIVLVEKGRKQLGYLKNSMKHLLLLRWRRCFLKIENDNNKPRLWITLAGPITAQASFPV